MSEKEKLPETEETGVLEHETPLETADVPERETSSDGSPPFEEEIEAANARERFLSEARRFGLPVENRFMLTQTLCEKAEAEPSQALLRLACYILCDTGVLLDMNTESRSPEEDVAGWQIVRKDAEELYAQLSARKRMSAQFRELLERLKKTRPVSVSGGSGTMPETSEEQVHRVGQAYSEIFPLGEENVEQLCGNISLLLNIANSSPDIAAVKPLFLYRVLTRHGKRLQTATDLRPDFRALWKYKHYKIDNDNGKNYRIYAQYLSLFETLYDLFETDETVDAPLCLYGFECLSNLTDFYRRFYPEEEQTIPFSHSVEGLLLKPERMFSCFEYGYGKCVIWEEFDLGTLNGLFQGTLGGLFVGKWSGILSSKDKAFQKAFEKIEGYLNANAAELLTRFLQEREPEQVSRLCAEILENVELPEKLRPKNGAQTTVRDRARAVLFQEAIKELLIEKADVYAEANLIRACKLLTGGRVE